MDAVDRSVIAYIAGRMIIGEANWVVHDHSRNKRVQMEGLFSEAEVKVYSHELNGYVSGRGAEGKYVLLQHSTGSYINLSTDLEEKTFSGWDHRTSRHFFGNVAERTVSLFDFENLQWHRYTL